MSNEDVSIIHSSLLIAHYEGEKRCHEAKNRQREIGMFVLRQKST